MDTALCIYSKIDETNASFKTKEHIIPKCIGGTECLPLGWVSDEVNNEFSSLEIEFARNNPLITINRMFEMKTGRQKHKNRERIAIFEDENGYGLGYILEGKPISIDCIKCKNLVCGGIVEIIASLDLFKCKCLNLSRGVFSLNSNNQLLGILTEIKDIGFSSCKIIMDKIPEGEYLIGLHNHKIYLGVSKEFQLNKDKIYLLTKIIDKMLDANISKSEKRSSQVKYHIEFKTNIYKCFRVYAKIAFNAFAKIKGHDIILNECFDDIRNAILTGKNIQDYVYLNEVPNIFRSINNNYKTKNMFSNENNFHSICFFSQDKILYGLVFLYGATSPIIVILSLNYDGNITDGYICDWKNKKEGPLLNFVSEFCNVKNKLLLDTEQI